MLSIVLLRSDGGHEGDAWLEEYLERRGKWAWMWWHATGETVCVGDAQQGGGGRKIIVEEEERRRRKEGNAGSSDLTERVKHMCAGLPGTFFCLQTE